jgi:hypothetical protein
VVGCELQTIINGIMDWRRTFKGKTPSRRISRATANGGFGLEKEKV